MKNIINLSDLDIKLVEISTNNNISYDGLISVKLTDVYNEMKLILDKSNTIINFGGLSEIEHMFLCDILKKMNNDLNNFFEIPYEKYVELHGNNFMKLYRASVNESYRFFNLMALQMLGKIDENTEFLSLID